MATQTLYLYRTGARWAHRYSPPHKLQSERKKKNKRLYEKAFLLFCDEVLSQHKQGVRPKVTEFEQLFFAKMSLRNTHLIQTIYLEKQ